MTKSLYGTALPFSILSDNNLKVLSSEMDPAEIRLIDRSSLNREARKVFRKIRPPHILREPFKVLERLLVF